MKIPTVLSIAGSDPSGGAGVQGDIKTIFAEGCYGMAAITGLTAQNTKGVSAVMPVPADFLHRQIEEVLRDISPEVVKIGMLVAAEQVEVIADLIRRYDLVNVILDPIVAPTNGRGFADDEVLKHMIDKLFPISTLVTPNLPEAMKIYEILSGVQTEGQRVAQMQVKKMNLSATEIARFIGQRCNCGVLIKGGHAIGSEATDYLWTASDESTEGLIAEFKGEMVETTGSHGTGCALSSSIASNIAKGYTLEEAVYRGKKYVTSALKSDMQIGMGNGSVDHGALIRQ